MAKDRFSNQKRSVYDTQYRYGTDTIKEKWTPLKKGKMTKSERKLVEAARRKQLNDWEKGFVADIRHRGAPLSKKQKEKLEQIVGVKKPLPKPNEKGVIQLPPANAEGAKTTQTITTRSYRANRWKKKQYGAGLS